MDERTQRVASHEQQTTMIKKRSHREISSLDGDANRAYSAKKPKPLQPYADEHMHEVSSVSSREESDSVVYSQTSVTVLVPNSPAKLVSPVSSDSLSSANLNTSKVSCTTPPPGTLPHRVSLLELDPSDSSDSSVATSPSSVRMSIPASQLRVEEAEMKAISLVEVDCTRLTEDAEPVSQTKYSGTKRSHVSIWRTLTVSVLVLLAWLAHGQSQLPALSPQTDSVYVPGGGFSGFWFTLGRLRSIPDAQNKDFYCYSSGCLAVVSTLSNYTMEEVFHFAVDIQKRWQAGEISRYEVVGAFVDDMLGTDDESAALGSRRLDPALLSRLNIITSAKSRWMGLKPVTRTPSDIESLRTMLLQTTWIPFAIGHDLWHVDHMDGAFTVGQHPTCAHRVGVELNLDLISETVNVNLGHDKVEKFWNMGMAYGF